MGPDTNTVPIPFRYWLQTPQIQNIGHPTQKWLRSTWAAFTRQAVVALPIARTHGAPTVLHRSLGVVYCDVLLRCTITYIIKRPTPIMHRTQIYLQEELHETLKARARSVGVSMSELIRRTLETSIEKNPVADAHAFFDRLTPLASYTQSTPEDYVTASRSKSRLLRAAAK